MHEDVTDEEKTLSRTGIVDANRIAIMIQLRRLSPTSTSKA